MPTTLSELYRDFVESTNEMIHRFEVPVPANQPYDSSCPIIHEDGQALQVVKLQNSWADFCRTLISISAANESSRIREATSAVTKTMGLSNPVWHGSEFVVRVAKHLTLANADQIELHLGASVSAGHVMNVRNYIVHPGSRTQREFGKVAEAEGVPGYAVSELLNIRFPGGASLFERWVKNLQRTANNAASSV